MKAAPSSERLSDASQSLAAAFGLDQDRVSVGNLELWPFEGQVFAGGRRVALSPREFDVLHTLAVCRGHVVSKARIFECVWGRPLSGPRERSVDVYVRRLRLKLADAAPGWEYIHTHFARGYRLEPTRRAGATSRHDSV